ncbi:hypothetical protein [Paractinoplanes atraurantiacus]|uniref:Uncharacterized protein n=1 Tax=Paractinoplanes atraurantiacus TaxID=1036182 RepID=A0A285JUY4_9ACTN|nr:hypothetical protein [Actinoplanes atraurantiacus]SNY64140.1 hypothetical protein SAMN05421748_12650 [Actinoplanes atraurantiacus]
MEDWDAEQERRAEADHQPVSPLAVLRVIAFVAAFAVLAGFIYFDKRQEPDTTQQDAAVQKFAEMIDPDAPLRAAEPNALDLAPGETVTLRNTATEVRVTPGKVTAGAGACGPLLTVALTVEGTRGAEDLTPGDFALVGADGSAGLAVERCSTGFDEGATERTVVFTAVEPGRLTYGPDPNHPVAVWRLA